MTTEPILRLQDIVTEFATLSGRVRAVNGVTYDVLPGQTLGVVGESGSGKSVTVMSALGLLPRTASVHGRALFRGRDLLALKERELQRVRGRDIGLIFQDPMTALNPVMTIGAQIDETLKRHSTELGRRGRADRIVELLTDVGIPAPRERKDLYPHQFSGGMRQRAMIAMALANRPSLLIADEPTTALDVTVQAQILDLLRRLSDDHGTALVLITHDLGVIAEMADRVVVMYGGRVVESSSVDDLFHASRHPYTRGLLRSMPGADERRTSLTAIPGAPPDPRHLPTGCAFQPRCDLTAGRDRCLVQPELTVVSAGHGTACHFHDELTQSEEVAG
ncbi:ABC transporter ATP-binding protein [Kribbella sp.]|uniref:ABC transporter ATP-binding protein n=1 Tax=Kribbella sp. TaxID=1871183 RepID=UPI002D3CB250|nr:ABC transporter ATP-binding protein [Kribbella sp.]HZX07816.1 ABC transporter ATP-binding protein [Kribbella sp.]